MADYDDTLIDLPMNVEVEEEEEEESEKVVNEEEKDSEKEVDEKESKSGIDEEENQEEGSTTETEHTEQPLTAASTSSNINDSNLNTDTDTSVNEEPCSDTTNTTDLQANCETVGDKPTDTHDDVSHTDTPCETSTQPEEETFEDVADPRTCQEDPSNDECSSSRLPSDSDGRQESVVTVEVIPLARFLEQNPHLRESGVVADDITANSVDITNIVDSAVQTETVEMSDQQRLEEKLRQFQEDAKEREEDRPKTETTLQITEAEKQRRRNLIFDEERFEETFLKCLICREVYNETDKLPKMLHCHHTFCMDCLYQMYRVEGEFRQSLTSVFRNMPLTVKIQCPTCREGIIISEAELRRLPNDHTIMELLCFVNKTGKNDVQYCPKHQMQPLNFFCEPCIMPVCCDCTVLDHKESKGHRVVNVDEAMKKYTPIVEETLNDIRKEKTTLAGKREALENTQEDLNQIQSGISDQIRKVFDSIREVLDERERELHDVAESEVERKQAIIDGHLNTISDRESDLNAEFNALQLAKDDKDISLIFTGHKSSRDLLARKVFIPTNSTAGFSITFQFSSRADTLIKQQVANLGDIIFHS